jgi:hypothetical protein
MNTEDGRFDRSAAATLNKEGSAFRLYATSDPSSSSNPCAAPEDVRPIWAEVRGQMGRTYTRHAAYSRCKSA